MARERKARPAAQATSQVALLVDFDNAWYSLRSHEAKAISPATLARILRGFASTLGSVAFARVYTSDPRRVRTMQRDFTANGYSVIGASAPQRSADVRMALDAQEILFTQPDIHTFVLVSGDSDFVPLARAIVEGGKELMIVAPRSAASAALKEVATVVPLEDCLDESQQNFLVPMRIEKGKRKPTATSRLRVFLCHSSHDKPKVRELYSALKQQTGIQPWFDEEDLLPGQDWELEISKAVKSSHCVIVCLTEHATSSVGYLHKEVRFALDVADRQPEGQIFLIPVKIEECDVPERLSRFHWVELYKPGGYELLLKALHARGDTL
jgi:uncharacterized protein (TIGR00288 family)